MHQVLQSICKTCSRILLKPADQLIFRERLKNPNMPYLTKKALRKKLLGIFLQINSVVNKCVLFLTVSETQLCLETKISVKSQHTQLKIFSFQTKRQ